MMMHRDYLRFINYETTNQNDVAMISCRFIGHGQYSTISDTIGKLP